MRIGVPDVLNGEPATGPRPPFPASNVWRYRRSDAMSGCSHCHLRVPFSRYQEPGGDALTDQDANGTRHAGILTGVRWRTEDCTREISAAEHQLDTKAGPS